MTIVAVGFLSNPVAALHLAALSRGNDEMVIVDLDALPPSVADTWPDLSGNGRHLAAPSLVEVARLLPGPKPTRRERKRLAMARKRARRAARNR